MFKARHLLTRKLKSLFRRLPSETERNARCVAFYIPFKWRIHILENGTWFKIGDGYYYLWAERSCDNVVFLILFVLHVLFRGKKFSRSSVCLLYYYFYRSRTDALREAFFYFWYLPGDIIFIAHVTIVTWKTVETKIEQTKDGDTHCK